MRRVLQSATISIIVGIVLLGLGKTQLTDIQRSFLKPECFSLTMIDLGPPEEEVTGDKLTSFYPTYLMQPQNAFVLLEPTTDMNFQANSENSVLIIVDVQNDFFSHDAPLKVPGGERIVEGIIKILPKFSKVVVTLDWHPPMHISFASRYVELNLKTDKNQLVQQGQKYEFTLKYNNSNQDATSTDPRPRALSWTKSWPKDIQNAIQGQFLAGGPLRRTKSAPVKPVIQASSIVPVSSPSATPTTKVGVQQPSGTIAQNSSPAILTEKLSIITWARHCVQNTVGAELHKDLRVAVDAHFSKPDGNGLPKENLIKVYKGVYENHESFSGFVEYDTTDNGKDLKDENGNQITLVNLKNKLKVGDPVVEDGKSILIGPPEIFICGLAAEYCVKYTALDAKKSFPKSAVYIITDAVGYFTNFFGPRRYAAFKELQDAGVLFTVISAIK